MEEGKFLSMPEFEEGVEVDNFFLVVVFFFFFMGEAVASP